MDSTERLKRVEAGRYQTEDGRFTVQGEGSAWYVRDGERRDPLGQAALFGPYRTLGEARHALVTLRSDAGEAVAGR